MPQESQQSENTQGQGQQKGESQGQETQGQKQSTSIQWPEQWRDGIANGDQKRAANLARFSDPGKIYDSWAAMTQRLAAGELRSTAPKPAGENVAPEAVKAWRTERGLPVELTEIKVPLPAGAKMEDLDEGGKARVEYFTKAFYDADLSQPQIDKVMTEYNAFAEKQAAEQTAADGRLRDELEDNLRADWGGEFRSNLALTDRFMTNTFGEDVADAIMGARTADGRRLFNIPEFFKAIHSLARETGDDVVTGETQIGGKSVDQRIEEINNILVTDRARYNRENLGDEKLKLLQRKEGRAA